MMNKDKLATLGLPAAAALIGVLILQAVLLIHDTKEGVPTSNDLAQVVATADEVQEDNDAMDQLFEAGIQDSAQASSNPDDYDSLDSTGTYTPLFASQSRHVGTEGGSERGLLYKITYDEFSVFMSTNEEIQDDWVGDGWSYELIASDPMWSPEGCSRMPTAVIGDFIFVDDFVAQGTGEGVAYRDHFIVRFDTRGSTPADEKYGFFGFNKSEDDSKNHPILRGLRSSQSNLEMIFELTDPSSPARLERIFRKTSPGSLSYEDKRVVLDQSNVSSILNPIFEPVSTLFAGSSIYTDSLTQFVSPVITDHFREGLDRSGIDDPYVLAQTSESVIASISANSPKSLTAFNKTTNAATQLFDESVQASFGAFLFPLGDIN